MSNTAKMRGVCGVWSVQDIVAHMASYEGLLIEILNGVLGIEVPAPFMQMMMGLGPPGFNDAEVAKRHDKAYDAVLKEYLDAYAKSTELLAQIPEVTQRQAGLLEWYGPDYDLEDFLVYTYYAHKREHGGEINAFKYRLHSEA